MAVRFTSGKKDRIVREIVTALDAYQAAHPRSDIQLYRQGPVAVRIRVVDPGFQRTAREERHDQVWEYLGVLSEEAATEIVQIVVVTPAEVKTSNASYDFDHPEPLETR